MARVASMSAGGRPLELAVARASARYLRDGRAGLRRQHVPWFPGPDGVLRPVGDAPIDFLGCTGRDEAIGVRGRMLAIECKETSTLNLPLVEFHDSQRSALDAVHALGAIVLVVCDFTSKGEVYAVTWQRVAEFIAKPWRKSLSLDWFMAYGLVLPEENRGAQGRRTLFLDGKEHWARVHAQECVEAEQLKSGTISLEEPEEPYAPPPAVSAYAGLTKDQIKERIVSASNDGIARQLKTGARRGRFKKRGART